MTAITNITGSHGCSIEDDNLQQKLSTATFWSIFNLNILLIISSAILDGSHYQKSQKIQQKPYTTKFGSVLNLNMLQVILLPILDVSHSQKSHE